jgi:hypothetical protein
VDKRQEKEVNLFSAKFKRDYVAYLAVTLFFLILVSEVAMAVTIPLLVRHKDIWDQEVAKQGMASFFDFTRDGMRDISGSRDERIAGEAALIVSALDEMAIYLRRSVDFMSRAQINQINDELNRIPPFSNRYKNDKKAYSSQLELNMDSYLKKLEEPYKNNAKEQNP